MNYNVDIIHPDFENDEELSNTSTSFRECKESEVIGIVAKWVWLGQPIRITINKA